jgi:hypothetical protein
MQFRILKYFQERKYKDSILAIEETRAQINEAVGREDFGVDVDTVECHKTLFSWRRGSIG